MNPALEVFLWFLVSFYALGWFYALVFLCTAAFRAAWYGDTEKRERMR
jgi:hypothetical protein